MKERSSGLIIGISIGVVIGALLALAGLLCFRFHRKRPQIGNSSSRRAATIPIRTNGADTCTVLSDSSIGTESSRTSVQNGIPLWFGGLKKGRVVAASGILEYSYNIDLQKANYNFTSLIGQGAFGPVYKAQMATGEADAVKVLATDSKQGEKEFQTEVNPPVNVLPGSFPGHSGHNQAFNVPDDLPKTVARTLKRGSSPMSMDFHPIQQTLLLVGTNVGDMGLWEVGSRENLVIKNFIVWNLSACSVSLQAALVKDPGVSVNRVIWSPDGSLFGVAYSRHIVQIYSYLRGNDVRQNVEIDAHVGGVNDFAFSHPNKQLCVITCGDDKTIKVWDATTGVKKYTFEGHEAPVCSVCPHYKENIQAD